MSALLPTRLRVVANNLRNNIEAETTREGANEIERLREACAKAADIIDHNWNHQAEKLPDASAILRNAISK